MKPSRGHQKLFHNILLSYGLTILTLLLASAFTEGRVWGFSWFGYFAPFGQAVVIAVGLGVPLWLHKSAKLRSQVPPEDSPQQIDWLITVLATTVAASLIFYFGRTETHFLGDGYLLLSRLESGSVPIRPWNKGVYFVLDSLHQLVKPYSAEAALLTFRIVSWLTGLLFVLASVLTAARLYTAFSTRLIFILGSMTGGYALMFFGYVENYPMFVLCVAIFAMIGLLICNDKVNRWVILVPVVVGGLFHPFAVAMIPAAIYLLTRDSGLARRYTALGIGARKIIPISVMVVTVTAFFIVYFKSMFLRFAVVPLLADQFTIEGYTLFSPAHLIDFVNLLFQLLPALPLLLVVVLSSRPKEIFASPPYRFLLYLTVTSLLVAFMFDPKLGMPRDWDMFCFAGIPMTLLLYYFLLDSRNKIKGYLAISVLALSLNVLVLAPRVVTQAVPTSGIDVFDSYSQLDVIKNGTGRFLLLQYLEDHGQKAEAARRRRANAALSPHLRWDREGQALMQQGKIRAAMVKFRQALKLAPSYSYAWANLGGCFVRMQQYDSAIHYLRISDGLNPFNSDTYNSLGYAYLNTGDTTTAETYLLGAVQLRPDNRTAMGNLLQIYSRQNRTLDYENLVLASAAVDGATREAVRAAADIQLERGNFDAASQLYRKALAEGLDSAIVRSLEAQHQQLDVLR